MNCIHINNITQEMMQATIEVYDQHPVFAEADGALAPILQLCDSGAVDICAAHNRDFDQAFIDAMAENPPLLRGRDRMPLPWICTYEGIHFPQQKSKGALRYLAVDHGIPLGSQKHRALADVQLVCELLALVDDLDEQIVQALKPTAMFQALVSYDDRDLAKKAGFRWNSEARRWQKKLPADTAIEPTQKRPFPVRVVG